MGLAVFMQALDRVDIRFGSTGNNTASGGNSNRKMNLEEEGSQGEAVLYDVLGRGVDKCYHSLNKGVMESN